MPSAGGLCFVVGSHNLSPKKANFAHALPFSFLFYYNDVQIFRSWPAISCKKRSPSGPNPLRKGADRLRAKIMAFFQIPSELRQDFWEDAVQKNRISLLVISIMIFGMELFNIARVLFWSSSGLGTRNNRIYFSMYVLLLAAAAFYLLLQRPLRRSPVRVQWGVQYGTILLILLWHVCLNAYDLSRDPNAQTSIFITAILGVAIFIQMPSLFSLLCHGAGYLVFMGLAGSLLSSGDKLNLTITAIVALAVSFTRSHHETVMIAQQQEIRSMNQQLRALLQKDPLTGLLNRTAFQECVEQYQRQETPEGSSLALLMVDLDSFKGINDQFGHPCGDDVLRGTAVKLQDVFPDAIGIGRMGGDEFAVLLRGPFPAGSLEESSRQLAEEISTIHWRGQRLGATCSTGICLTGRLDLPYDRLYGEADRALYQAKTGSKGGCCLRQLD